MNLVRLPLLALLFVLCPGAWAGEAAATEPAKILVTFSDPGMSNASRAGPSRPGYSRRAAGYLVSVGVKRAASRLARDYQLQIVDEWPIVALRVHCLVYAVSDNVPVDDLLAQLRDEPAVESVQLLNRFTVMAERISPTDDPYKMLQHNLETLDVSRAHSWSRGDGASVTIIDTGADLNHPELRTQISSHRDFAGGRESEFSTDAHGTAIAGIIAAASNNGLGVVGVAPSASVTVLKACWYDGDSPQAVCNSFTLAKALAHAVDSGTNVINLSFGGPSDGLLTRLVSLALDRGMVVVAADPGPQRRGFPSDIPGVIVAGGGAGTAETGFRVQAPADEILVAVPGGGFDYASGSSLSAAQVSGVVALLIARKPRLSHGEVNLLLADSPLAAGESINACRALATLLERSGCRAPSGFEQALNADSKGPGQGKDNL